MRRAFPSRFRLLVSVHTFRGWSGERSMPRALAGSRELRSERAGHAEPAQAEAHQEELRLAGDGSPVAAGAGL